MTDELRDAIAGLISGTAFIRGQQAAERAQAEQGTEGDDPITEPEFTEAQVAWVADLVLDVLDDFGWVEPDWQGRWALFGEDFIVWTQNDGDVRRPNQEGAYHMDLRGGVPSFWRILCQAAVRRGWIDQSAAPPL